MSSNRIAVHDKTFEISVSEAEIQKQVERIAREINRDLADKNPVFLGILNGAFMFASDLFKHLDFPTQISFLKLASYSGTSSTGAVRQLIGINMDLKDRIVVVIEDIVDTGVTLDTILRQLSGYQPEALMVATFLHKPDCTIHKVNLDYVGIRIPDNFVVGYGLDYDGYGRNFKDLYTLVKE